MSEIDPVAVMDKHAEHVWGELGLGAFSCFPTKGLMRGDHCEPYLLAEALAAEQAKVARVCDAWWRYSDNATGQVPVSLQRAMNAALAGQPAEAIRPRCSGYLGGSVDCVADAGHSGDCWD